MYYKYYIFQASYVKGKEAAGRPVVYPVVSLPGFVMFLTPCCYSKPTLQKNLFRYSV